MSAALDLRAQAKLPAEFRGMGRAFMARCEAAQLDNAALVNALTDALCARHQRYPARGIPAAMMTDVERRWRGAGDAFRLGFEATIVRSKGTICECRVVSQRLVHRV